MNDWRFTVISMLDFPTKLIEAHKFTLIVFFLYLLIVKVHFPKHTQPHTHTHTCLNFFDIFYKVVDFKLLP